MGRLLLEDGVSHILTEGGDFIITEDQGGAPVAVTTWRPVIRVRRRAVALPWLPLLMEWLRGQLHV
jgi:hypothetical protein